MTEQEFSGENVAAEIIQGKVVVNQPKKEEVIEQEQPQQKNDSPKIEEAETEEDDTEVDLEKHDKPKKKGGYVRKLEAKDAEIEYWKQQALEKSKEVQPKEVEVKSNDGRPKLEDFDDIELWQEALTDWKVDQKLGQKEQKEKERRKQETLAIKASELRKQHPDFDDVVENLGRQVSKEFFDASLDSDKALDIAYFLGQNPEEYRDIITSNNIGLINRFLGKLEAKLEAPAPIVEKKAPVKITNAPEPISTLGGKVIGTKDYGKMSADEYFREVILKRQK